MPPSARSIGTCLLVVSLLIRPWSGAVAASGGQTSEPPANVLSSVTFARADQSKERAPLRVESVGTGEKDLCMVKVHSASDKTIVSYTLAWKLTDVIVGNSGPHSGKKSLGSFAGSPVTTTLGPKKSEKTDLRQEIVKTVGTTIMAKQVKGMWMIVVGVKEVVFDDGTSWTGNPALFRSED